MENIIKQTEANTRDIKTLSDAVIKLTILVEDCTNRMETAVTKQSFWDTDTKKYMLRLGFIFAVIMVLALIGTNLIEQIDFAQFFK
jgi:hypothetical protein